MTDNTHPTWGVWARQLLIETHSPLTDKNMVAMLAWLGGEGTTAKNNPLGTTRSGFGGTEFNTTGVKNYPTFANGIRATVATLNLTYYADIRAALKKGDNIQHVVAAVIASPWGTHDLPWRDALAHRDIYEAKHANS